GVRLNLTFGVDLSPLQPDTTPSDPSDDDSVARHFFIANPTVTGTVDLASNDINATARIFNFVEIGIQHGNGVIQAAINVALQDPAMQTGTDGRITLPELLRGISQPSTLVSAPTVTG